MYGTGRSSRAVPAEEGSEAPEEQQAQFLILNFYA
jgi:hypothetical protein